MSQAESVSGWIEELRKGDSDAATMIFQRFYGRVVQIAARRLRDARKRSSDEEDVAQRAMASLFRRLQEGQFPDLSSENDLWKLLATITERKALNQLRDERRLKRNAGRIRGESAFGDTAESTPGINAVPGRELNPQFASLFTDSVQQLLSLLNQDEQQVAMMKLDGMTNPEVAESLQCSLSTVQRRLQVVRMVWLQHDV